MFKNNILRSILWDFSNSYKVVKEAITITVNNGAALKYYAPFINCITKITSR